jgi:ABC-type oligopeptide transport system substrate-binding subunit
MSRQVCSWRISKRWCVITAPKPQSLDPHKIEGVPEANISRDLFEGLLNTSPKDGHPIPGVAELG